MVLRFTVPSTLMPTLEDAATPPEDSWEIRVWVAELSTTTPDFVISLRLELSPSLVVETFNASTLNILSSLGLETLMVSVPEALIEPPLTRALVSPVILLMPTAAPTPTLVLAPMAKPPAKL